jgi:anti-anti-sigma factor
MGERPRSSAWRGDRTSVGANRPSNPVTVRSYFHTILILGLQILRYIPQLMETPGLELEQVQGSENGNLVTRLNGKLSLETVHTFIQTMRQEPAKHLVLDMSGVSFLDSSGVGALVSLFVSRRNTGKTLAVARLTNQSQAVMQVSGLMKLIPTYPTVEEAFSLAS